MPVWEVSALQCGFYGIPSVATCGNNLHSHPLLRDSQQFWMKLWPMVLQYCKPINYCIKWLIKDEVYLWLSFQWKKATCHPSENLTEIIILHKLQKNWVWVTKVLRFTKRLVRPLQTTLLAELWLGRCVLHDKSDDYCTVTPSTRRLLRKTIDFWEDILLRVSTNHHLSRNVKWATRQWWRASWV